MTDLTHEKLSQPQRDLLRLIVRSPDNGDGWRKVSKLLWPTVTQYTNPALVELDADNMRLRLTTEGQTVARYL